LFSIQKNLHQGIFFNNEKALPGNKVPNRQIIDATDHRDLLRGFAARRIGRNKVSPTKVILTLLLLASAITRAFANPPGGSYIQCDPKNPRSPVRCTPDGCD